MRILHVSPNLRFGGSDKLMVDLARRQVREGCDVEIAVLGVREVVPGWFNEQDEISLENISWLDSSNRYDNPRETMRTASRLRRILRSGKFSVVHSHLWTADIVAGLAMGGTAARHFSHLHCSSDWQKSNHWKHRLRRQYTRLVLDRARTQFIAVSERSMAYERETMGWEAERVHLVHNGVDLDWCRPSAEKRSGGEMRVGNAGWFYEIKAQDILIRALAVAVDRGANLRLILAGRGPCQKACEGLSRELGISDRVSFPGEVGDMTAFFSAIDCYVLPSLSEGLPLTILEAMARGLPIIATDVGGVSEAILNNETGLLVNPGDVNAMADALVSLHSDPGEGRRLASTARQRVEECFDIEETSSQVLALYSRFADAKSMHNAAPQLDLVRKAALEK